MSAVYVLQHAAPETPGLISGALTAAGLGATMVRPFLREPVPRQMGRHAALVVMGGPMGVYEQEQHPFLRQELELIRDALTRQRPVLGVCLGSQLLAAALDARVAPGRQKEIGWHTVTLKPAAVQDPLWRDLPDSFMGWHWHGDVFRLPRGAVALASSKLTPCQAFRFGPNAYGLLFHAEVTPRILRAMLRTFPADVVEAGLTRATLLAGAARNLAALSGIGKTVFRRWAALAASR